MGGRWKGEKKSEMSHSASQLVGHDVQTEMCGRMAAMPRTATLTGRRLGLTAWSKVSQRGAVVLFVFPSFPLSCSPHGPLGLDVFLDI